MSDLATKHVPQPEKTGPLPSPAPPGAGQGQPEERRLVSDTGKLSGATGASYLVNLVGGIVLARLLGPALYGIWKSVQLAGTYSAFSNGGATYGIDRTCPAIVSRRRLGLYRRLVASSLIFSMLMALIISAGVIVIALPMKAGTHQLAFLAFAVFVLIQPFYQHGEAALSVEKKFGVKARVTFLSTTFRVVLSIVAAWLFGLAGVLAVFLAVLIWAAAYMLRRTYLNLSVRRIFAGEGVLTRKLIRVGLPITLLVFSEQFFLTIDKWIVLGLLGETMMGLYQMAIFPLPILLLVPFALRQVVSMDVYDKFGRTRRLDLCRDVYERSVSAIAWGEPIIIGAVYFGVPWLVDWFLKDYVAAIGAIKLHAVLIYPMLMVQTAFPIAVVAKKESRMIRILILGALLASLISCTLVLAMGMSFMAVLAIHGTAWTLFGLYFLRTSLLWMGEEPERAWGRVLRWFFPMAFLAVELPLVEWMLVNAGMRPYSFSFAVMGGLIHLVACVPFLIGLERRTGGLTYFLKMVRSRAGM